jgi:hypothetical protein
MHTLYGGSRRDLLRSGEDTGDAVYGAGYVFGGGLPVADADAHAALVAPGGVAEEGFAVGEDGGGDLVGEVVVVGLGGYGVGGEKADEALVDLRFPDELRAG